RVQVLPSGLEDPDHLDKLVAGLLVAEFGDGGLLVGHQDCTSVAGSSGSVVGSVSPAVRPAAGAVPRTAADSAPSVTRMRSCDPAGAWSIDDTTRPSCSPATDCTTA